MARVLIFGGVAALAFAIYAAVDCLLTERQRVRGLPRLLWVLVIVVLPVIGGVLWFLIGRGRTAPAAPRRVTGPDDDPEFLRRAAPTRPGPARAEDVDWRRLEQEFVDLDTEADDDGDGRRR